MSGGLGAPRFGTEAEFAIGVEEELILVDPTTRGLRNDAAGVLERMPDRAGRWARPSPTRTPQ